jgi:hypothetical protein
MMQPNGFNFDLLIDALADRVAAKVRSELSQDGAEPSIKPRLLSVEGAARSTCLSGRRAGRQAPRLRRVK